MINAICRLSAHALFPQQAFCDKLSALSAAYDDDVGRYLSVPVFAPAVLVGGTLEVRVPLLHSGAAKGFAMGIYRIIVANYLCRR
jgi:hypothetical protein